MSPVAMAIVIALVAIGSLLTGFQVGRGHGWFQGYRQGYDDGLKDGVTTGKILTKRRNQS